MRCSFQLRLCCMAGLVLAALLAGCSQQPADVTGPEASSLAPLYLGAPNAEKAPGSYIVVMKQSVPDVAGQVADIGKALGLGASRTYTHGVKGFAAKLSQTQIEALRRDPRIAYIEQDQVIRIVDTQPNPPSWGLDRVDQRVLPLDSAYSYEQTGAGVDAYIVDTGIRRTHVDFGGRAVFGADFIIPGGDAMDRDGHGTHVAGTVGGSAYGVAKGVRLIAVCVLDSTGRALESTVIAGLDWVIGDHTTAPAVANMSFGGWASITLDDEVRAVIADGVTCCVAAGNSSDDASLYSPAGCAEALTVGATDNTDTFATFSNYGKILDLCAPGVDITSAWNTSDTATNTLWGTSMATPHVTGAVAIYLQAHPTATPAQVAADICANATPGLITGFPAPTTNRLLYAVLPTPPPPAPPAAPYLATPANGATGVLLPPVLHWIAPDGATSYAVQVATDPGFLSLSIDQSGLGSTYYTANGLAVNVHYYWRVNATNAYGTSDWSAVWSFTTAAPVPPPVPTLVSPVNGATSVSKSPTLRWNASAGATSYRVQVSKSSSFSTLTYDESGITGTSTSLMFLDGRTTYYWRVNATGQATSDWSAVWHFKTVR